MALEFAKNSDVKIVLIPGDLYENDSMENKPRRIFLSWGGFIMDLLKQRILAEGIALPGSVLKVDSFLLLFFI